MKRHPLPTLPPVALRHTRTPVPINLHITPEGYATRTQTKSGVPRCRIIRQPSGSYFTYDAGGFGKHHTTLRSAITLALASLG